MGIDGNCVHMQINERQNQKTKDIVMWFKSYICKIMSHIGEHKKWLKNHLVYIDYPKICWGYEHGDILRTCRYSHEFTIKYSEVRCTKVISLLMVSDVGQSYSKMEIRPNKEKDLYSPTMIGHNLVHASWNCICAHCISREPRAASHKENRGTANVTPTYVY